MFLDGFYKSRLKTQKNYKTTKKIREGEKMALTWDQAKNIGKDTTAIESGRMQDPDLRPDCGAENFCVVHGIAIGDSRDSKNVFSRAKYCPGCPLGSIVRVKNWIFGD